MANERAIGGGGGALSLANDTHTQKDDEVLRIERDKQKIQANRNGNGAALINCNSSTLCSSI